MPCQCPDCLHSRNEPVTCYECQRPENECECVFCARCGLRVSETCPDCGYGIGCGCCQCDARSVPYESDYNPHPTERFHGEPSKRYPRYLGVEIECFVDAGAITRREYRALANQWGARITSDGSIRPESGCYDVEHVTAPARGDAFVTQLRETVDRLHAQGARVNKSCGLHVHVDAREFTTREILAFARLYSRVEKSLYSLVAKARRTNDFSRPWGDALTDAHSTSEGVCSALDATQPLTKREKALDVATYGSESRAQSCKARRSKDSSRYHGVNFNALACHGTIEFRLHHGTVNVTKIAMWAAVCSALVEYAGKHSEEEIDALRGTPAEILEKVISDAEVSAWCRKRRTHFETVDRQRRGLAPRARPVTPAAAPVPEVPAMPEEAGETDVTPPRAYRSYR